MTITGLGPILMPQFVSFLLSYYDSQGTLMIISALTLHIILGACLLQPVKWHAKYNAPESFVAQPVELNPIQNQTIYEEDEDDIQSSLNNSLVQ